MTISRQGLAWQAYLFQLPLIPERLFAGNSRNADRVSKILQRGGQSTAAADRDARAIGEPATFAAAINWYRGAPFSGRVGKVTVPTMGTCGATATSTCLARLRTSQGIT